MYRESCILMSKKLSVYLYSTEEADSTDATVISLLDCGNSGERYEQALKLLDADEAAIGKFFDAFHHDGEIRDFEGYQLFPGKKGQKIDINVRDEEKDKKVHSSTINFQEDINVLADKIDCLAFAEDFPKMLKDQILDVIAKHKDNLGSLPYRIANCATYFPLNHYRAKHPEVTDNNIYVGRIQHVSMDNMCFKIELDDKEKFDKKKLYLFGFTWLGYNITPKHSWNAYTMTMCPLLLYGNTLYYGYLTGEWEFDAESIKKFYGMFKFKENKSDNTFKITRAGFGESLAEGKEDFFEDITKN